MSQHIEGKMLDISFRLEKRTIIKLFLKKKFVVT